jgi:hypothetical protein
MPGAAALLLDHLPRLLPLVCLRVHETAARQLPIQMLARLTAANLSAGAAAAGAAYAERVALDLDISLYCSCCT